MERGDRPCRRQTDAGSPRPAIRTGTGSSCAGAPGTRSRSWGSLRPHFWLPLGINAGQAGHFSGAATAGTDAVGRYVYLAEAQVSPSPLRLQGSFFLLNHALGNPTLDFSFLTRWSLVGIDRTGHG